MIGKKVALILGVAVMAMTANAQRVSFGLKGGMNISSESQSDVVKSYISDGLSYRTAFHIGGVLNYMLAERWDLEADLLYSMQGYKDKINTTDGTQQISGNNYKVTSHYLTLPIGVKYYPIAGFYVECGPQLGYLLSKKGKLDAWEVYDPYTSDNIKRFEFGIFGGLGYYFTDHLSVGARYVHGLTGTSKEVGGSENRNFQISLGYLF